MLTIIMLNAAMLGIAVLRSINVLECPKVSNNYFANLNKKLDIFLMLNLTQMRLNTLLTIKI
jgi:hypothetical protein